MISNDARLGKLLIVESSAMTIPGDPITVPRSWKERLWSKPWIPFQKTKTVIPQVPNPEVYIIGNKMVMHPTIAKELRSASHKRDIP